MIKIEFSGLSFQDSDFINPIFNEGFLNIEKDDTPIIQTTWNEETYDVQYLIYKSYSIQIDLRESDYDNFKNIQYAPKVQIFTKDKIYLMKVLSFEATEYLNEFYKINVVFRDIESRKIENKILSSKLEILKIMVEDETQISAYINLPILTNFNFTQNLADDFSERISDFNKTQTYKHIRFYLSTSDFALFLAQIKLVGTFSNHFFELNNIEYKEYEPEFRKIGIDLFEITLKLYENTSIDVPSIDSPYITPIIYDTEEDYISYM